MQNTAHIYKRSIEVRSRYEKLYGLNWRKHPHTIFHKLCNNRFNDLTLRLYLGKRVNNFKVEILQWLDSLYEKHKSPYYLYSTLKIHRTKWGFVLYFKLAAIFGFKMADFQCRFYICFGWMSQIDQIQLGWKLASLNRACRVR